MRNRVAGGGSEIILSPEQKRKNSFRIIADYLSAQKKGLIKMYAEESDKMEREKLKQELKHYNEMWKVAKSHDSKRHNREDFDDILRLLEERVIRLRLTDEYSLSKDEERQGEALRKSMAVLTAEVYRTNPDPVQTISRARDVLKNIFKKAKVHSQEKEENINAGPTIKSLEKAMVDLERGVNYKNVIDAIEMLINEMVVSIERGSFENKKKYLSDKFGIIPKTIKQLRQARDLLVKEFYT